MKRKVIFIYLLFFFLMTILGSVYTYSIYRLELENSLNINSTISGIPYIFSLLFFSIMMSFSGRYLKIENIKKLVFAGGFLLIAAWLISALIKNIWVFTFSYGIMMGSAVGILYGIPLMMVQKSNIIKKGLVSGIMLLGFGLSSVIFSPFARWIIDAYSMEVLFYIYAILSFVVIFTIILVIDNAYDLKKDNALRENNKVTKNKSNHKWGSFFFIFSAMTLVGLTMIGLTNVIATKYYNFDAVIISGIIGIFALLNAISRPIFGYLMDKFSFSKISITSIAMLFTASIINFFNQGESIVLFFVAYGIYWFNLGIWLTIMPLYVKNQVGTENYSKIYGNVFLGYGVSALIGTLTSSLILESFGSPRNIYVIIMIFMIFMFFYLSNKLKKEIK